MRTAGFDTEITETEGGVLGPWRAPRQMLHDQAYDGHSSIHDDTQAQRLGFKGGTIEGPTHFSQFVPLCASIWGESWFRRGCISVHFRTAAYAGERLQASLGASPDRDDIVPITMRKEDGAEVLQGAASIGLPPDGTYLGRRIEDLTPPADLVILGEMAVGMRTPPRAAGMTMNEQLGPLYPFSLAEKVRAMTEPSAWYVDPPVGSPFDRPIIPLEMISVLALRDGELDGWPIRKPVVGLFVDQEIAVLEGPLYVGEPFQMVREVIALSQSRRTESLWTKTSLFRPGRVKPCAHVLLNQAYLTASYPDYDAELERRRAGRVS